MLLVACAPSSCARASPPAAPTGTETRMVNNAHWTRRWDWGGCKRRRPPATTTTHATEGNMYVYKLRTYETTRRKPNTGYSDLTAKRDAPTVTNSNGGGHTDKTSTRVQHRGLQLSATSTSTCEIQMHGLPRDQPRAPHLRDHAQADHEIRQLDRDVPAMTNGDGGNHTDDNSNPQTPTDSITEYFNEARTNKTGATPRSDHTTYSPRRHHARRARCTSSSVAADNGGPAPKKKGA